MEWSEEEVECSSTSRSESCNGRTTLGLSPSTVVTRLSVEMLPTEGSFFYYIGLLASLFFLWWFVNELFKGFRLFVWSRIRPTRNLTVCYGKWAGPTEIMPSGVIISTFVLCKVLFENTLNRDMRASDFAHCYLCTAVGPLRGHPYTIRGIQTGNTSRYIYFILDLPKSDHDNSWSDSKFHDDLVFRPLIERESNSQFDEQLDINDGVVTGSTDGIGKGYALELAKRGLNICLIARNESKLINVANEIKSLHHVAVKWIVADFSRVDIYDYIEKELSALDDIGILVNNVGVAPDKWEIFCNQDKTFSLSSININITSCVLMTQIILKRFIPQDRGLIINVGSMSSVYPLPYGAVYSSTKVFIDNFTLCLHTELSGTNIDVQCLRPFFVQTNLVTHMTTLKAFHSKFIPHLFPRVEVFTRSAVKTLNGHIPLYTCGYWPMSLNTVLIPLDFFSRTTRAKMARIGMKYCFGAITKPKFKSNNNC